MKNLAIGRKLLLAFAIVSLGLLAMAGMSMWTQAGLNRATEVLGHERRDKLIAIAQINAATADYRIAEASTILSVEAEHIQRTEQDAETRLKTVATASDFLEKNLRAPAARVAFNDFRRDWARYVEMSRLTRRLGAANDNDAATLRFRESKAAFDAANSDAVRLKDVQVALMNKEMTAATASYQTSRMLTIALVVAVLALTAFLLVALIRGIAAPITAMTGTMSRLAAGDLQARVEVDERRDEVGRLANALVQFRDQLAAAERAKQEQTALIVDSVGRGLHALAEGDLTARIDAELTGPFAQLKTDFNSAMAAVSSAMTAVSVSATGITNGASDIRQASDDLSQRTEQQAASLEETAAA
ncbi:HAMP domain-containing protein, partial [Sphingomonas sp. BE138]|uniref:HAMP domain-containing protein n=1 Tax=Sphingomonas sp. BE138 TaxID=2817845 RepID=UPI00286AD86F